MFPTLKSLYENGVIGYTTPVEIDTGNVILQGRLYEYVFDMNLMNRQVKSYEKTYGGSDHITLV